MARTGQKRLVTVVPYKGATMKYGFKTNIPQADSTALGHAAVTTKPAGFVFGANAPKPARASKRQASGVISSFIDAGAIARARQGGWSVGQFKFRPGGATAKSVRVYVTIDGIKFAWNMPLATLNRITAAGTTALGIRRATVGDRDLVFGASEPRPPKAYRQIGEVVVSTYYDPSKSSLPAGWMVTGKGDPEKGFV